MTISLYHFISGTQQEQLNAIVGNFNNNSQNKFKIITTYANSKISDIVEQKRAEIPDIILTSFNHTVEFLKQQVSPSKLHEFISENGSCYLNCFETDFEDDNTFLENFQKLDFPLDLHPCPPIHIQHQLIQFNEFSLLNIKKFDETIAKRSCLTSFFVLLNSINFKFHYISVPEAIFDRSKPGRSFNQERFKYEYRITLSCIARYISNSDEIKKDIYELVSMFRKKEINNVQFKMVYSLLSRKIQWLQE